MRYRLSEIPLLLRTPVGRLQVRYGIHYRSWPLLSRLAALHRRSLVRGTRVVAIVGTYGKSTTTRAAAAALNAPLRPDYSYNAWSGVALSVLAVRRGQRHAIIEVGIDNTGQMAGYARLVRPDIVVVTSIGSEHHRSLGTLEVTRHEKAEMVRVLPAGGTAVLNGDDPNVLWMRSQTRARTVTFGFGEGNDVRATDVRLDWPHGTRFTLHAGGQMREMSVRLLGRHMVYPVLAAAAVALAEGRPLDQFLPPLQDLPPTPGRLEPMALPNGAWLLRDDTKSGLETIEAAVDVLADVPGRCLVALGEINEAPGRQGAVYQQIGRRIAGVVSCGIVVATEKSRRSYTAGAASAGVDRSVFLHAGHSVRGAAALLRERLQPGDVVLIKGRAEQRMARIALSLLGRDVRCDIVHCRVRGCDCADCPMLERGWGNARRFT